MIIRFQIGDISLRCGEMAKNSENHEIWATFDPAVCNFFGEPHNFKTSFGNSFSGPIARKSLDHAPTLRGEKNSHSKFSGEGSPWGYISYAS